MADFSFKKCKNDPVMERQFEQMTATIQHQQATIDYIALMTDVEIPTEEQEDEEDE